MKILLIEDSIELSQVIQRELTDAGFEVQRAFDGEEGLEKYSEFQPDLVVLDWMLPKMDGLEVLKHLQQQAPVPVLMLTAKSEEYDRVIGLEIGADDYLTKPFGMRELIARIKALFRRVEKMKQTISSDSEAASQRLVWKTLEINPDEFLVMNNAQRVELSKTEYNLLSLFIRNPGRVFNRHYLHETIWGEQYIEGDRSVDNAILRLRKKLGELGDEIETVWGIGYRLRRS